MASDRANEKALMQAGVIAKDLYINESNNQGGTAFNMDKFKSNDPEMQGISTKKNAAKIWYENYQPEIAGCQQSSERCNGTEIQTSYRS
jgi:hypothetical protein